MPPCGCDYSSAIGKPNHHEAPDYTFFDLEAAFREGFRQAVGYSDHLEENGGDRDWDWAARVSLERFKKAHGRPT